MAEKDIYGHVPTDGVKEVFNEAMEDLNESSSNKINGPTKSKDSDYPEQD